MTERKPPATEALRQAAEWARAEEGVSVLDDGTLQVAGDPPLALDLNADDERLLLIHHHTEAASDTDRTEAVRAMLPVRGSVVRGEVAADEVSVMVTLTASVYVDGLSRQGFVATLHELVGYADSIRTEAPSETDHPADEAEPEPESATVGEPPAAAAVEIPADTAPTLETSAVWAPTHRVPAGGMTAWPEPDGSLEPSAQLEARVELSIAQRRGDWAHVVGSNGWTGWVDARRLEATTVAEPATPNQVGTGMVLAAVGAVGLIASAFFAWFEVPGFSVDSFDIALAFLWDSGASGEPALGYLVAASGGVGLAALFAAAGNTTADTVRRIAGIVGLVAGVLFVYQVHQGFDASFADVFDSLGVGVLVAIPASALLIGAPARN